MGGIAFGERVWCSRGGPDGGVFAIFRRAMEGGGKKRRDGGVDGETSARATLPLIGPAKEKVVGAVEEGAKGPWVPQRPMDAAPSSRGDRASLWGTIPRGARLEASESVWVELPEAGAARERKG